jgi:hypothetical protein
MIDMFAALEAKNLLSPDMKTLVQGFASRWSTSHYRALLETHILDETTLADCFAQALGKSRVYHLTSAAIEREAIELLPYKLAKELAALPMMFLDEQRQRLEIAVCDPFAEGLRKKLADASGCEVTFAIGERTDILKAIDLFYPILMQIPSLDRV